MGISFTKTWRRKGSKPTKVVVSEHNSIFQDILPLFERVSSLDDADAVLLWSDVTWYERAILNVAQYKKIPTYVLQHGRKGSSRYYPPFNLPITADKMLVWGRSDKEALVRAGHPGHKIEVVGCPHFIRKWPEKKKNNVPTVVFCPEHWDREIDENIRTRDMLRKLKGVKLVTKLIDGHDPDNYDNVIQTDRQSDEHIDTCLKVLSEADLVVSLGEGTFELLAQAYDIPVVVMNEWEPKEFGGDPRYKDGYYRVISDACKQSSLKDLNKTIKQQLAHPEELHDERMLAIERDGGWGLDTRELIKNLICK